MSVVSNYAFALVKIIAAIAALSVPALANAVFSVGIGTAKLRSLQHFGTAMSKDLNASYRAAGLAIVGASASYLAVTALSLLGTHVIVYQGPVAIVIALVTFIEVSVAIPGVFSKQISGLPLVHANKLMNLASAFVSLALTQSAILSFAYAGDATIANALGSGLLGGAALLIGLGMCFHASLRSKTRETSDAQR